VPAEVDAGALVLVAGDAGRVEWLVGAGFPAVFAIGLWKIAFFSVSKRLMAQLE
jgi:hypothetical protein